MLLLVYGVGVRTGACVLGTLKECNKKAKTWAYIYSTTTAGYASTVSSLPAELPCKFAGEREFAPRPRWRPWKTLDVFLGAA